MKMWKEKIQKFLSIFTIAQMLLVFAMPTVALGATIGYASPTQHHAGYSTHDFSNGDRAYTNNDTGAQAEHDYADELYYGYGISIPAGSTVTGVNVSTRARRSDNMNDARLNVSVSWDAGAHWSGSVDCGSITHGDNYEMSQCNNSTWGRTWTASELSDTNFRVRVQAIYDGSWASKKIWLDWIPVTVVYSGPADTTPPVISAHSDEYADATSAAGAVVSYTLPTATDAVDGSLPVNCVPASGSTFAIGDTTVTCTATDSSTNTATTTFVVHVVDTAPVITLNGTTPFQVEKGTSYTELGADWTDAVDGTGPATVGGDVVDVNTLGTYTVTYNYTDTAGNAAAQVTRTVIVVDTISPNIEFIAPTPADGTTLNVNSFQVRVETDEDAVACELVIDGSTYAMTSAGGSEFYLNIADLDDGNYTYEVTCWDASENDGNSIARDVNIDTAGPVVEYIAPTPDDGAVIGGDGFEVRVDAGDAEVCYIFVDSEEFSEQMTRDGESNEFWFDFGDVPEGTYEYYVVCYDEHQNQTVTDPRTITLDQTPPVLTLVGANPLSVTIGGSFTDPGATAYDNEDGDITANIVKSGDTVNTGALGSYIIRYNVSDSVGNAAAEVTRTVNVVAAPVVPVTPVTPVVTPVVAPVVAAAAPAVAAATAPAVAAAETTAPATETPAAEETAVKGSSDKACPWWWIVALVLLVVLAFLGGVIRALDENHFVRKFYYVWPPVLALIAWFAHRYLQDGLQATWLCNHYWFVMLVVAVLGELGFGYLARNRKEQ